MAGRRGSRPNVGIAGGEQRLWKSANTRSSSSMRELATRQGGHQLGQLWFRILYFGCCLVECLQQNHRRRGSHSLSRLYMGKISLGVLSLSSPITLLWPVSQRYRCQVISQSEPWPLALGSSTYSYAQVEHSRTDG